MPWTLAVAFFWFTAVAFLAFKYIEGFFVMIPQLTSIARKDIYKVKCKILGF